MFQPQSTQFAVQKKAKMENFAKNSPKSKFHEGS